MADLQQGIPFDSIESGAILGNIHCGEITSGVFANWKISQPFEIERDMFMSIYSKLDAHGPFKPPLSGKTVYAVSATEDHRGNAGIILVIYEYDNTFRCTTLTAPEWKTPI